ncbi:predicted protein [Verticillium alfalfae VaMs.102]|uniref:Predicted protein n=1 Tax=Verticillium alfalfae (strain VaMs.102 / ATCC MYA-4576 / FGSC 10136) TaxID=526221 RepID=C9ST99_VERA1|nr:predicted protein [Verticillium alfalfae VaMs.102]EEY22014.1 predicted protein [Verticillium alfalfae VaMs.102]
MTVEEETEALVTAPARVSELLGVEKLAALFVRADLLLGQPDPLGKAALCLALRPTKHLLLSTFRSCPFASAPPATAQGGSFLSPAPALAAVNRGTGRDDSSRSRRARLARQKREGAARGHQTASRSAAGLATDRRRGIEVSVPGVNQQLQPIERNRRSTRHKEADPTPTRTEQNNRQTRSLQQKLAGARCGGVITCSQEDPPML